MIEGNKAEYCRYLGGNSMLNILICDDDKTMVEAMVSIVENVLAETDKKAKIHAFTDATLISDQILSGCDIALLDIDFEEAGYNGMDIARRLRKKHQGAFDNAAAILMNVAENHRSIPWLRSHFSIDILRLNELVQPTHEWNILLNNLLLRMNTFKEKRKLRNSDYYFYEAYYPIVCFYKSKFNEGIIPQIIKIEDQAIAYYEKEERRYLTNCYFIKAELYRIAGDWKNAEEFYTRCYNIFCHTLC